MYPGGVYILALYGIYFAATEGLAASRPITYIHFPAGASAEPSGLDPREICQAGCDVERLVTHLIEHELVNDVHLSFLFWLISRAQKLQSHVHRRLVCVFQTNFQRARKTNINHYARSR